MKITIGSLTASEIYGDSATRFAWGWASFHCLQLTLPRLAPSHMEKLAEHGSPKTPVCCDSTSNYWHESWIPFELLAIQDGIPLLWGRGEYRTQRSCYQIDKGHESLGIGI